MSSFFVLEPPEFFAKLHQIPQLVGRECMPIGTRRFPVNHENVRIWANSKGFQFEKKDYNYVDLMLFIQDKYINNHVELSETWEIPTFGDHVFLRNVNIPYGGNYLNHYVRSLFDIHQKGLLGPTSEDIDNFISGIVFLLKNNFDPWAKDYYQETPLEHISYNIRKAKPGTEYLIAKTCSFLFEAMAKTYRLEIRDRSFFTPYLLTIESGYSINMITEQYVGFCMNL